MSQAHTMSPSEEITFHPEHKDNTKHIWKTFWILTIVTLVELGCGYWIYTIHTPGTDSTGMVLFLKGVIAILTVVKAFYIVAVFMHLGDEIRNFILTIVVPLALFIWFILGFILDGASWLKLRNTDAGSRPDTHKTEQVHPPAHEKDAKP